MAFSVGAWVGCSSSNGPGGTGAQSCQGNPGDEFCSCNAGSCKTGYTCAVDLQQCVHIAGTPQPSTGGSSGTGNTTVTGSGTGGGTGGSVTSTGGSAGTHATGSGGVTNTGGSAGTRITGSGGMTNTGGSAGRATGSGGMTNGGAGGSATSTGGTTVTSTACTNLMPSASGNGEFTWYYFGQGTGKDSQGKYQPACGYLGTESGTTDTVDNIANTSPAKNTYFAAIPGNSGSDFNSRGSCGTCIQISNAGHTIIATIIDECPGDSNPTCMRDPKGELDLSKSAFDALGFPTGNPSGTTWKAVPCPVTGNVVVRIKSGNQNEAYIENTILAIKSVSGPGGNASRQSYGAWHFNSNLGANSQLTLTDAADRMIQVTLMSGSMNQNQDTGKQFPACQ